MKRTRQILREYGYQPRKSKAQHFLVSESALDRIAAAARIHSDETVIEIGPGPGNLTRRLVAAAGRVIAIEIEHELCSILRAELKADNLTVVEADALEFDFTRVAPASGRLKVAANLPYNITTPILFRLLETPELFSEALLLVQEEVANRICASPGNKTYGILAVQTQAAAEARIALRIGPEAFLPRPRVNSALIRLDFLAGTRPAIDDRELFRRVVRAAFARRRKTLRNCFGAIAPGIGKPEVAAALDRAGIDPRRRPETLRVEEFADLANLLAAGRSKDA